MIANFFNKTKSINFLVLSVLMAIAFTNGMMHVLSENISFNFVIKKTVFLLITLLTIYILNFIINKNQLTDNNTYAIFIYILLTGFFANVFVNENIFTSNFILLFAFRRIYSLRSPHSTKEKIFDSAFWIAIASLFYAWSFLYVTLLYIAIYVFRKDNWRYFFIPIIGFVTPLFLFFVYQLFNNNSIAFFERALLLYDLEIQEYGLYKYLIPILFLIGFLLISIYTTTKKSFIAKIDFKNTWIVLILHLVISVFILLLSPNKNGSEFLFTFFPLSIIFANYLQTLSRFWARELILYLFLGVLVSIYWV